MIIFDWSLIHIGNQLIDIENKIICVWLFQFTRVFFFLFVRDGSKEDFFFKPPSLIQYFTNSIVTRLLGSSKIAVSILLEFPWDLKTLRKSLLFWFMVVQSVYETTNLFRIAENGHEYGNFSKQYNSKGLKSPQKVQFPISLNCILGVSTFIS